MKGNADSARATFTEKTEEFNGGRVTSYEVLVDWATSGSKSYRKELSRSVDGHETVSLSTTIYNGKSSISIVETIQKKGNIERQISKTPSAVHVADVFSGCYRVHDQLIPDALASNRYKFVKNDATGCCFEGPYQGDQRIRFWLSPQNDYLIKKQEIFGDGHFHQVQEVSAFARTNGHPYPASGEMSVFFENASTPTIKTSTRVKSFLVGEVPEAVFNVDETGSAVTDSTANEVYAMSKQGKVLKGSAVDHVTHKGPPTSGQPYGIAALAGFPFLSVGLVVRIRHKLGERS